MGSARILVVEDEAIVTRDIVHQLETFGHHVVANTQRGEEAVEVAATLLPDLVLMDIQLAGTMDGVDAAQVIRRNTSIPVVFLTAFATDNVLQRAKQASPFGFLIKPFDPQQLKTAIELALYQHEVESKLSESRDELATILRTASDAFFLADAYGRLLDVNEAACNLLGYTREELLTLSLAGIEADKTPEHVLEIIARVFEVGAERFERRMRRKDGSLIAMELSLNSLPVGEGRVMAFARDISARKRADEERDVTVRMLNLINQPTTFDVFMREVTLLLREWSGCSSVGIRLTEGDDFPYYETRGFPPEFVELERHVCQHQQQGHVVHDAAWSPELDCLCFNIIRGRFERAKPFFSARGSFWTNSTTQLLAITAEDDRQVLTRHRCICQGHESVALVPLRAGAKTYGLLQFNDRRKNLFTPERIPALEVLADRLAIAISQRRDQAALQASEERFRRLLESTTDYSYAIEHRAGGQVQTRHGAGCEKVTGYTPGEFAARQSLWVDIVVPEDLAAVIDFANAIDHGKPIAPIEHRIVHKNGSIHWVRNTVVSRPAPTGRGFVHDGLISDVTNRKRLEAQLQQAQRMEAMGQLAGGVAHDFNNMLGVILGFAEMAIESVDPSNSLHGDLVNIQTAAQRSADLTRQLLAFSRKQTVAPKVQNLNDVVSSMLKMVRRLIGEDVKLEWRPGGNLWPIKIDTTQIDQVLANLCVNARDAISNVGSITIETGTKVISAKQASDLTGAVPGDYVWLSVGDDGCGMDAATMSHMFEPFFTTKEVGKGTGLGLATVYGIVKQNNGFIDLCSELGRGTSFTIYVPRHVGEIGPALQNAEGVSVQQGEETILLVEDESPLLVVTQRMLEMRGYRVIAASTPRQALQLAREHRGTIDLLMTDVVMPEMNGRDLAGTFSSLYPQAKCLFMSGYTADVIAHQGVLEKGVFFIQKPFSAKGIAAIVRNVLDSDPSAA